jgi:bacitracin transport system ATP-binding protein
MQILKTHDLTKKYKDKVVVNKLNMTINKGDIYGFLGQNGAGKTTTLKMILGQTTINSGELEIFGELVGKRDYAHKSRIGALMEVPSFYMGLTARENLEIHRRYMGIQDKKKIDEVIELVGLSAVMSKSVRKFSLGMKQRLSMARALLNMPELLILDEPINGLDPVGISDIRRTIQELNREKNVTVLFSSHILSEVQQLATKVGIIHESNLLEEIEYKDLEEKNKSYLQVIVDNEKKAVVALEQKFGITQYRVYENGLIRIFERLDEIEEINRQLITSGIGLKQSEIKKENLEDYFLRLTGGRGHV